MNDIHPIPVEGGFVGLISVYVNVVVVVFGAIVGSFLNVVIVRWPKEQSIVKPRSACPHCGRMIAWYDNIPVVSFVVLRARCRHCGGPISWRYPLVELLTAAFSLLMFHRFVGDVQHPSPGQVGAYLLYLGFVAGLVAITFIDLEHYLIPDLVTLTSIPIGILGVWAVEQVPGVPTDVRGSVIGALIGGGSLYLMRLIYQLIRKDEGMGLGDVKMMAMIGTFLGPHPALVFVIFVSSFLGSVAGITMMALKGKDLKYALPFGPFLAVGAIVYLLWGFRHAARLLPLEPFVRGIGLG